jgi:hypothetical protein
MRAMCSREPPTIAVAPSGESITCERWVQSVAGENAPPSKRLGTGSEVVSTSGRRARGVRLNRSRPRKFSSRTLVILRGDASWSRGENPEAAEKKAGDAEGWFWLETLEAYDGLVSNF